MAGQMKAGVFAANDRGHRGDTGDTGVTGSTVGIFVSDFFLRYSQIANISLSSSIFHRQIALALVDRLID